MDGDRFPCGEALGCQPAGTPDAAEILKVAIPAYDGQGVAGEISRTPDRAK